MLYFLRRWQAEISDSSYPLETAMSHFLFPVSLTTPLRKPGVMKDL
jgi:hypothetical protein